MRIELLMAIFLLAAPISVLAACSDQSDHSLQRKCLEQKEAALSSHIRASEDIIRARISGWDQEPQYKSDALALFNSASEKFRSFMTAQCNFEASSAAGGNGAGDMRLGCRISLSERYLGSLKAQAARFSPPHA
jgi:hypothetical protein